MATLDDILAEVRALRGDVAKHREETAVLLRGVVLLTRHLGAVDRPATASSATGRVAGDAELDGQYGDGKVMFDPRGWDGASHKGGRMSECEPEYLDLLAEVLDRFADDERDKKKQRYKRDDAARARGWARRKRAASAAAPTEDV